MPHTSFLVVRLYTQATHHECNVVSLRLGKYLGTKLLPNRMPFPPHPALDLRGQALPEHRASRYDNMYMLKTALGGIEFSTFLFFALVRMRASVAGVAKTYAHPCDGLGI